MRDWQVDHALGDEKLLRGVSRNFEHSHPMGVSFKPKALKNLNWGLNNNGLV